jgi:hypothetical protein
VDSIRAKYVDEWAREGKLSERHALITICDEFRARRPAVETGFRSGQRRVWKKQSGKTKLTK